MSGERSVCANCGTTKAITVHVASARGVAERWAHQYGNGAEWKDTTGGSSHDKYNRLLSLGDDPNIEAVAEIIGNKSWSHISCDGCGSYVTRAVSFDPYGTPVNICEDCIKDGQRAFAQAQGKE